MSTPRKLERIGVFGGTFDPVHPGHVALAIAAKEQGGLDRVLVTPSFLTPGKDMPVVDGCHRYEMLGIAFRDYEWAEICDYEIRKQEVSFTEETVRHVRHCYPDSDLYLVIGADNLTLLKTWRNWRWIISQVRLLVYPRPGFPRCCHVGDCDPVYIEGVEYSISSSRLRAALKHPGPSRQPSFGASEHGVSAGLSTDASEHGVSAGLSIDDVNSLMDSEVLEYIKAKDLYREWQLSA